MKQFLILFFITIICVHICCSSAMAHSTKGRKKIMLELTRPTSDDFAFFMESYVYRNLHNDEGPQGEKRYYVAEFQKVEFSDNEQTARVFFLCLDNKTRKTFQDSMLFHRDANGSWLYTDKKGNAHNVYTYVKKSAYYYNKYGTWIAIVGILFCLGILAIIIIIRRLRKRQDMILDSFPATPLSPSDSTE